MNFNHRLTVLDLIEGHLEEYREESTTIFAQKSQNQISIPQLANEVSNGWLPLDMEADFLDEEYEKQNLKRLYSDQITKMEPYVMHVLNEYDYEKSPIYDDDINESLLEQLTEQSFQEFLNAYPMHQELEMRKKEGNQNVIKDLFQYMILCDLFYHRRPNRRKNSHKKWCKNPCCGYGQKWK